MRGLSDDSHTQHTSVCTRAGAWQGTLAPLSAQPWVSSGADGRGEGGALHPLLIFPGGWPVVSAQ